jgi:hypothetical protein
MMKKTTKEPQLRNTNHLPENRHQESQCHRKDKTTTVKKKRRSNCHKEKGQNQLKARKTSRGLNKGQARKESVKISGLTRSLARDRGGILLRVALN